MSDPARSSAVLLAVLLAACVGEPGSLDLLWPAGWEPLPACENPWTGGDAAPETVPAWGLLFMNSEGLQPAGELLSLRLDIRAIGGPRTWSSPGRSLSPPRRPRRWRSSA